MNIPIDAAAPQWAHAMVGTLARIISAQAARIRELEARVKALETP